jgi:hypothetical protein
MDPSVFDTLVRAIARSGTRRRLLAGLPLLGTLAVVGEEEAAAQRPLNRLQQRTTQRNRKQRNNNQNNGGGGGGGGNNNGGGGAARHRTRPAPAVGAGLLSGRQRLLLWQEGVAGTAVPANICKNNQGQPVCCQHRCLSGVCCPCDNASRQQCVSMWAEPCRRVAGRIAPGQLHGAGCFPVMYA